MTDDLSHRVSVAVLAHNRRDEVLHTLARLEDLPHREVVVVDSGSTDGTADAVAALGRDDVVLLRRENIAVEGRTVGVEAASGEYVLLLDDDAYPTPGAIERLAAALDADPTIGVVTGFMVDVDEEGAEIRSTEPGTFDWFFRAGREGDGGTTGFPTYFFCEGGCMVRRDAYLEVGGFYAPYFFAQSEIDLTMRLVDAGWDVRYVPTAVIHHRKADAGRVSSPRVLQFRVRNQIWFWLRHFPVWSALLHLVFYGVFDLMEATLRGHLTSFARGVGAAIRDVDVPLATRSVKPAAVRRRAGRGRALLHVRLVALLLRRRLLGVSS